jgi:hypothetical protein
MKFLSRFVIVLFVSAFCLTANADVPRPAAGQGAVFVDDLWNLSFSFWDNDGDSINVYVYDYLEKSEAAFATRLGNGDYQVHVAATEANVSAWVDNKHWYGQVHFTTNYKADCPTFIPGYTFWCFIGPGSATMNVKGTVYNYAGETRTLDGNMTGIPVPSQIGNGFYFPNFDISVH